MNKILVTRTWLPSQKNPSPFYANLRTNPSCPPAAGIHEVFQDSPTLHRHPVVRDGCNNEKSIYMCSWFAFVGTRENPVVSLLSLCEI